MKRYFEYELTQLPTASFKDSKMKKSNKSFVNAILRKDVCSAKLVIDEGSFLHRVQRQFPSTYNDIVMQSVSYVRQTYGTFTIVFDGYLQGPSTKAHEQVRRNISISANVQLQSSMVAHGPQ